VPGEVQQQQVVGPGVGEEALDGSLDLLGRAVDQLLHIEATDRPVAEHAGQRVDVAARRPQLREPGVGVRRGGDEQRPAPAARRFSHRHGAP
jgi:hypothetical protein